MKHGLNERLGSVKIYAVCRVGQATAPAHHLSDVVGLRSAGPTLRVPQFHKLANCGVKRVMPAPQQET